MDTLNKILTVIAIFSVLFLVAIIYNDVYTNDLMCYNPDVKVGFTQGLYEQMNDCDYNGDEWECNEGKFKYCY
jgi:hypothetical protein